MRGDQLAQRRVIRALEADPNGLTVTEITHRQETGIRTINLILEILQAARFPLHNERADRSSPPVLRDTFKFKISPLPLRKAGKHAKGCIQVLNAFIIRILAFLASLREVRLRPCDLRLLSPLAFAREKNCKS
jgi:hypothetical protein